MTQTIIYQSSYATNHAVDPLYDMSLCAQQQEEANMLLFVTQNMTDHQQWSVRRNKIQDSSVLTFKIDPPCITQLGQHNTQILDNDQTKKQMLKYNWIEKPLPYSIYLLFGNNIYYHLLIMGKIMLFLNQKVPFIFCMYFNFIARKVFEESYYFRV